MLTSFSPIINELEQLPYQELYQRCLDDSRTAQTVFANTRYLARFNRQQLLAVASKHSELFSKLVARPEFMQKLDLDEKLLFAKHSKNILRILFEQKSTLVDKVKVARLDVDLAHELWNDASHQEALFALSFECHSLALELAAEHEPLALDYLAKLTPEQVNDYHGRNLLVKLGKFKSCAEIIIDRYIRGEYVFKRVYDLGYVTPSWNEIQILRDTLKELCKYHETIALQVTRTWLLYAELLPQDIIEIAGVHRSFFKEVFNSDALTSGLQLVRFYDDFCHQDSVTLKALNYDRKGYCFPPESVEAKIVDRMFYARMHLFPDDRNRWRRDQFQPLFYRYDIDAENERLIREGKSSEEAAVRILSIDYYRERANQLFNRLKVLDFIELHPRLLMRLIEKNEPLIFETRTSYGEYEFLRLIGPHATYEVLNYLVTHYSEWLQNRASTRYQQATRELALFNIVATVAKEVYTPPIERFAEFRQDNPNDAARFEAFLMYLLQNPFQGSSSNQLLIFSNQAKPLKKRPIVFLDIDGVLNTFKHARELDSNDEFRRIMDDQRYLKAAQAQLDLNLHDLRVIRNFCPRAVLNLRRVCEELNPLIVLSSDWRTGVSNLHIHRWFEILGLGQYYLDKTKDDGLRGAQIKQWRDEHPEYDGPYVAIDDNVDDFEKFIDGHYVECNSNFGFADDKLEEVRAILSQPPLEHIAKAAPAAPDDRAISSGKLASFSR